MLSNTTGHQITFLKPKGTKVALNPVEIDWSIDEYDSSVDDVEEFQADTDMSISDYIDQPGKEKVNRQVEVDGKLMYKASIVRQLFTGEGASKDRLRRVQGLSRFAGASESNTDLHDMLLVGDPVVVYGQLVPQICIVQKILVGNKQHKSIEGVNMDKPTTSFAVHESAFDAQGDKLIWTGQFKGQPFKIEGSKCQSIKPDLLEEGLEGKYFFDKQLIIDLGVQFTIQPNPTNVPSSSSSRQTVQKQKENANHKKCFKCKKSVLLEKMRGHVGRHILKGDLQDNDPNICGFCGSNVCQNKLVTSSVTHGKKSYKIESNCIYLHAKMRAPVKSPVREPCTN